MRRDDDDDEGLSEVQDYVDYLQGMGTPADRARDQVMQDRGMHDDCGTCGGTGMIGAADCPSCRGQGIWPRLEQGGVDSV